MSKKGKPKQHLEDHEKTLVRYAKVWLVLEKQCFCPGYIIYMKDLLEGNFNCDLISEVDIWNLQHNHRDLVTNWSGELEM